MKLGLIIKNTQGGEQEAYAFNKDQEWAKYASDARSYIKQLTGFNGTGCTACFVRFVGTLGYFICVVKATSAGAGRDYDNTAAWMFVPAMADLSGRETEDLIRTIETAVSGKYGIDEAALEKAFSKDYVEKNVKYTQSQNYNSPAEGPITAVYYGTGADYSLTELLGTAIAQPEYAEHKAIFFLDKQSGIGLLNGSPLAFKRMKQLCTVNPPAKTNGFKPFINSGKTEFSRAVEVMSEQKITITWKCDRYKDVKKSFVVTTDGPIPETAQLKESEMVKLVPRERFIVVDEQNNPLTDYLLKVNGREIKGEYIEISEAAYNQSYKVEIAKKEFQTFSKDYNLSDEAKHTIRLKRTLHHYEFNVPCYDGNELLEKDGTLTIETTRLLYSSPLKGYNLSQGQVTEKCLNDLEEEVSWWPQLKYFLFGFGTCFAFFLLYAGYQALDDYKFKWGWPPIKKIEQKQLETVDNGSDIPDETTYRSAFEDPYSDKAAIAYLNNKTGVWHKDSLEQYPLLQGLFDDMNNYELRKLSEEWKSKIKGCGKFDEIASRAENAFIKGLNPDVAPHSPQYNKEGDKLIRVQGYIDWLSKEQGTIAPKDVKVVKDPKVSKDLKDSKAPKNPTPNNEPSPQGSQNKRGGLQKQK